MAALNRKITGGVDTHKDVHVAAVIDEIGRIIATASFRTGVQGYLALVAWMRSFGEVVKVGVEGTGCYGAGLARHLSSEGICVVEVNRPNRQMRRRRGKSDTVDAEAAARAALNGEAEGVVNRSDEHDPSCAVRRDSREPPVQRSPGQPGRGAHLVVGDRVFGHRDRRPRRVIPH